jgi:hypothetical protein
VQWVGGPLDQDYDVVDITGSQSAGGHHALLYATTQAEPLGTTRLWNDADQLTTRLMGGVGGEGGGTVELPPGVVFRVQKGSYLVVQMHYLNAGDEAIIGRTTLDMALEPANPSNRVASIMATTDAAVQLEPGVTSSLSVACPVEKDLVFLQIANHMHSFGASIVTDYEDPSGVRHELKHDPAWNYEWALNPNFESYSVEAPRIVPAGSTIHTDCSWNNTTDRPVTFPEEMCVFVGFVLHPVDIYCRAGVWSEAIVGGEAIGETTGSIAEVGGCTSSEDQALMDATGFDQQGTDCATGCAFAPDMAGCTATCYEDVVGLSPACARCNGEHAACGAQQCLVQCAADSASPECRTCVSTNCDAQYLACQG